ncbi:MAG: ribokinase [Alphaproteobacteria bacterium]
MPKVVIAGSINMDVVAYARRLPLPGETIHAEKLEYFPGGKGLNQAIASARYGASTMLAGKVGEDDAGIRLLAYLKENGVDVSLIGTSGKEHTGTALITVAGDKNTIVVAGGANMELSPKDAQRIPLSPNDIVVSQFETPLPFVTALFVRGHANETINILNPSPARKIPRGLMRATDILVVNETELGMLAEAAIKENASASRIVRHAASIATHRGQRIVVTLGKRGQISVMDGKHAEHPPRQARRAVDPTAAGDCFLGNLAGGLAENRSFDAAMEFASAAAAMSVEVKGAAPSLPAHAAILKRFPELRS